MISTYTSCRLKPLALAFAVAAFAVPIAQATLMPSAGKYGPLDPWADHLIHQNSAARKYGPLDPWAYDLLHREAQSSKQHAAPRTAAASVPPAASSGFDWSDAAIGAAVACAAMLLAIAAATFVSRSRKRLASNP